MSESEFIFRSICLNSSHKFNHLTIYSYITNHITKNELLNMLSLQTFQISNFNRVFKSNG